MWIDSPSRPTSRRLRSCPRAVLPGADPDANAGDRSYLVLAKPNVIINDIRLRGLAMAGTNAVGRKGPDNHAQTSRNLRRSLRTGIRLIQAEELDTKSATEVPAILADALEELQRLQRSLDRRTSFNRGTG
jgi:hypothetical protein